MQFSKSDYSRFGQAPIHHRTDKSRSQDLFGDMNSLRYETNINKNKINFYFLLIGSSTFLIVCAFFTGMIAGTQMKTSNPKLAAILTGDSANTSPAKSLTIKPDNRDKNVLGENTGQAGTQGENTSIKADLSAYTIDIQNGSGVTGAATKLKQILTAAGFTVDTMHNADNSNYKITQVVLHKAAGQAYVNALQNILNKSYITQTEFQYSDNDDQSQGDDVIITIGKSAPKK